MTFLIIPSGESYCNDRSKESAKEQRIVLRNAYAKKKEQEGYSRLSIDEEMWKLYGRKGIDYPEEQYEKLSEQVEAALQKSCCP